MSSDSNKPTLVELSEKNFDDITIQDIADRADVNRGTIYLHYIDKYDLLDKMIDEHINKLWETTERVCEMEWVDATKTYFEYFESNYLFFSTMLASKGAPSFRRKFLEFLIEAFKDEVDKTKNHDLNSDIIVKFAANAYVGVLESWLKEGMPFPANVMANELGILLERIV